jgi:hypothetical protein
MQRSDFEIITDGVAKFPGSTARELATQLRRLGHEKFTSKLANQLLYRLLSASMVERDGSGDKPRWHPVQSGPTQPRANRETDAIKRPLNRIEGDVKLYSISDTSIKVLIDWNSSPNDPYLLPDWVGSHVVASINANHPFWSLRLTTPADQALYCMICAADAYVQWKVAQLHEPPDATEVQILRDFAFRLCTLVEAEAS